MAEAIEQEALVTFTPAAKEKIVSFMEAHGKRDMVLLLGVQGRTSAGFQYNLALAGPEETNATDAVVDVGEFKAYIDAESVPLVKGSTVDFVTDDSGSGGIMVDNPNPVWEDERALAVQELLDTRINPVVANHGGHVELLDVTDRAVYLRLGGGCVGCGMVDVTLKQGIEVLIKQSMPEIEEVIDQTDHASGTNPYYQPAKA